MYDVYILTNKTNKVMYIGVTNDLKRRLYEHQHELVEGFTQKYHVHKLIYYEQYKNIYHAISREKQLKHWKRDKKNALVETLNSSWEDLSERSLTMPTFELQFLGTSAFDFSPRLEGDCKDCFDKDARRSSALLINGHCLIDCGIHTLDALRIIGKPYLEISDLFVTHLHGDHFNRDHVAALAAGRQEPLRMWVREDADVEPIPNVTMIKMSLLQRYEVSQGLFLTGMPANHAAKTCPQHLMLEKDGKKIFYGCDGGWLLNATCEFLQDQRLSLAVFDCTVGDYVGDFRLAQHNSIPMLRLMIPSLMTIGAVTENTQVYFSHLAPSLHKPHDETAAIAQQMGANVAYDGLQVTVL